MYCGINLWFFIPLCGAFILSTIFWLAAKHYNKGVTYPISIPPGNLRGIIPNLTLGLGVTGLLGSGFFRLAPNLEANDYMAKGFLSGIVILSLLAFILSLILQVSVNNKIRKDNNQDIINLTSSWPYKVLGILFALSLSIVLISAAMILISINK